jgi:hypothetical protein
MLKSILAVCASVGIIFAHPSPPAAAAAVAVNIWETFTLSETTCSGERVSLEMRVHFVRTLTESSSGITLETLHLASVGGIGTTSSGATYLLRDGSNTVSTGFVSGFAAQTFTANIRLHVIGLGKASVSEDLVFRAVFHTTTNAIGEVVVQFDRISDFECR